MSAFEPFQLADTPLVPGVTLIEASAGTGKTFTIAAMVLRLVLELRVPIDEILAVTYTVAATAELRDRVHRRLHEALVDLRAGRSEDEVIARFLLTGDVGQGIRDLNLAVQNFDEAPVLTIHGFCQRVLQDHAFESGLLFEMELMADPTEIFEEVAHDFWRTKFYPGSSLLSRLVLAEGRSPGDWIVLLERMRNHPDLAIIPPAGNRTCAELWPRIEVSFGAIISEWQASSSYLRQLLAEDKSLSRDKSKSHYSAEGLAEIFSQLDELSSDLSQTTAICLGAIHKLSRSEVERFTKSTGTAPIHPFFDLCEAFRVLVASYFHQLTHDFIAFARRELPLRKERRNVLTFDDLTVRLRDALSGPTGAELAATVGAKFRAVLLDEFQDTDPIQYEIFRKLFAFGKHYLVYIGDPKQAIYGFRGADVFTYLRAASGAAHQFTLGTNWRSEGALLDGVNALFTQVSQPFLFPQISYRPVHAPPEPRKSFALLEERISEGPLRFRWLDESCNQEQAEARLGQAVVEDIIACKASGASLGGRPLASSDIAVLVRSNAQASALQKRLRARGVKSVLRTEASVFHSEEAPQLQRLLEGVLNPSRSTSLKTALMTSFIGLGIAELVTLEENEGAWENWLQQFLSYRQLWEDGCFMAMFRHFLIDQKVRERLVHHPSGERALTNFLHLSELLHQAETDQRLTPSGLCAWLQRQRANTNSAGDADQLRLESDDDAVLLATIHKSKGLEYPVVFCPFLWKAGDNSQRGEVLFHDAQGDDRLTLDLRDRKDVPEHDHQCGQEHMAESLRVLYVALTRAQNRCYVYAGKISGFEHSPLAYLLGNSEPLLALKELANANTQAISLGLISSPAAAEGVTTQDVHAVGSGLAREFQGGISQTSMMASFTGLTAGRSEEEPDRDAVPAASVEEEEANVKGVAGFERGVRAGVFFHDVLEHLDFTEPESIEGLVATKLVAHGMANQPFRESVSTQVRTLLDLPLTRELTLRQIPSTDRLNEVEFTYPIVSLRPSQLQRVFSKYGSGGLVSAEFPSSLGRLQFRPVEGFMRGFMDCLLQFQGRYYLLDWKSNWLGSRASDYDLPGLQGCMLQHSYFLQYHLYTVATDLFLSQRLKGYDYDTHFGGVFYIFLRGLDPMVPGRGVFHDRPPVELVRELKQELVGLG